MLRKLTVLLIFLGVAVYAGPQIKRATRPAARPAYQVIAPSKARVAAYVAPRKTTQSGPARLQFLSRQEKINILKTLGYTVSPTSLTPPLVMNLTVKDNWQKISGFFATLEYWKPNFLSSYAYSYLGGIASFPNSPNPYSAATMEDPSVTVYFEPLPGKKYVFDCQCQELSADASYYVYVKVQDSNCFEQTVTGTHRLMIVFPGRTTPGSSAIQIRGNDKWAGFWGFHGCQISEF